MARAAEKDKPPDASIICLHQETSAGVMPKSCEYNIAIVADVDSAVDFSNELVAVVATPADVERIAHDDDRDHKH